MNKIDRKKLRALIEQVINEDPFDDMNNAFDDMDSASDKVDDKSNFLKTASEVKPAFVKKVMDEAESKKQEILKNGPKDGREGIKNRAKAEDASMTHITSHGIQIERSGDYIVETQDGNNTRIKKSSIPLSESLSRGSLYRRRYHGRY